MLGGLYLNFFCFEPMFTPFKQVDKNDYSSILSKFPTHLESIKHICNLKSFEIISFVPLSYGIQ